MFSPGVSRACATVVLVNDQIVEMNETFTLSLESLSPQIFTQSSESSFTILNTDGQLNIAVINSKCI